MKNNGVNSKGLLLNYQVAYADEEARDTLRGKAGNENESYNYRTMNS